MPLTHPGAALDPNDYVVAPHVAILDTFRMSNPDGSFAADITESFIDRLIAHMAEREIATGDLCPLVIGHTQDGLPETEQPPLVGYAKNWHKGTLGSTGRACAFFDAWVQRERVDQAKQFPRRSAEVWASRYEIDPISLLGATTPARDLGLLKLNREGSFTYTTPAGEMQMPDEKKSDIPTPDPKETGATKGIEGKLDQLLSMLTEVLTKIAPSAPTATAGAPPVSGAEGAPPGAPGGGGEMSDQEYEALLKELMGEGGDKDSRAGEEKTPNASTVTPEPAKMSRQEQENEKLQVRLRDLEAEVTRGKVRDQLVKLSRPDIANPDDTALVEDLVAMAPEARQRQFERIAKSPGVPGQADAFHLNRALDGAVPNAGGTRKRMTREDSTRLSRKASAEKKTFEQVAAEEGYDLYSA